MVKYSGQTVKAMVLDSTVGSRFPEVELERFFNTHQDRSVPPSKRYMKLVTEGARFHKLDENYISTIEKHPVFNGSSFFPIAIVLVLPLLVVTVPAFALSRLSGYQPRILWHWVALMRFVIVNFHIVQKTAVGVE